MALSLSVSGFETEGFQLLCDFVNHENFPDIPVEAMERLNRILIQVQGGQISRPRVMFKLFDKLAEREPTEDEVREVYVMAWVVELLQFAILASDDIVDGDLWRRGRWSWHRQPGVGLSAVYDTFVATFLALAFLKKHLDQKKAYIGMVESINREILYVQLYQSFDTMVANQGPGNVSTFCEHKLRDISLGLCGYFFLPFSLMLHYLGQGTPDNLRQTREITDEISIYYQAQNDYIDLYGDRSNNGKDGRDIRENKCSWLIVEALNRSDKGQRTALKNKYGRSDKECVDEVKQIFNDLDLKGAFKQYQSGAIQKIKEQIQSVDEGSGHPYVGTRPGSINVIVSDKQDHLQYLTIEDAIQHCTKGAGIWPQFSTDAGHEPGVQLGSECIVSKKFVQPMYFL
ncbi:farnesyl-pyrophosphate synthetase [Grosmannia clavigera kw1407]|uniref:Farnesyl-pyrophosphate synthetase n=1 Tax=Grosmannia clavigera (strain kw1407 / UAMH 11150) TaxID=655863 RepID=F0XQW5_GROCL|nr:farnesyl-pyrophosphate synthetase [Grosmannia clavigera kw1407]EFW99779.1 farnesyl-pyrophosphate synthetase [Grosmannia clavigera kw1407]